MTNIQNGIVQPPSPRNINAEILNELPFWALEHAKLFNSCGQHMHIILFPSISKMYNLVEAELPVVYQVNPKNTRYLKFVKTYDTRESTRSEPARTIQRVLDAYVYYVKICSKQGETILLPEVLLAQLFPLDPEMYRSCCNAIQTRE